MKYQLWILSIRLKLLLIEQLSRAINPPVPVNPFILGILPFLYHLYGSIKTLWAGIIGELLQGIGKHQHHNWESVDKAIWEENLKVLFWLPLGTISFAILNWGPRLGRTLETISLTEIAKLKEPLLFFHIENTDCLENRKKIKSILNFINNTPLLDIKERARKENNGELEQKINLLQEFVADKCPISYDFLAKLEDPVVIGNHTYSLEYLRACIFSYIKKDESPLNPITKQNLEARDINPSNSYLDRLLESAEDIKKFNLNKTPLQKYITRNKFLSHSMLFFSKERNSPNNQGEVGYDSRHERKYI